MHPPLVQALECGHQPYDLEVGVGLIVIKDLQHAECDVEDERVHRVVKPLADRVEGEEVAVSTIRVREREPLLDHDGIVGDSYIRKVAQVVPEA